MPAASKRTVTRAQRDRATTAQLEHVQGQSIAHARAKEYLGLVRSIRDEMFILRDDFPSGRKARAQRKQLLKEIAVFDDRVRGARAYVIETGMALCDGVPDTPAEPPPRVRSATMQEAAALAKKHEAK